MLMQVALLLVNSMMQLNEKLGFQQRHIVIEQCQFRRHIKHPNKTSLSTLGFDLRQRLELVALLALKVVLGYDSNH